MEWPALPPDVNPIEIIGELWLEMYVLEISNIFSIDEFQHAVFAAWERISEGTFSKPANSVSDRALKGLKVEVAAIKYWCDYYVLNMY